MTATLFFRKDGKLQGAKVKGFSNDIAKDLGGYSHSELRSVVGIKSGAVLARAK